MSELLKAHPVTGKAIKGPDMDFGPEARYMDPQPPVVAFDLTAPLSEKDPALDVKQARLEIFFRLDDRGEPVRDSQVRYYVPEDLMSQGRPSEQALRLVAEREQWPPFEPEPPLRFSGYKPGWEAHYWAGIWTCGDYEYCDCHQPQIILRTPNLSVGQPWYRLKTIWEGEFISEPEPGEVGTLEKELEDECRKRGLLLGSNPSKLTWEEVRAIDAEQMSAASLAAVPFAPSGREAVK